MMNSFKYIALICSVLVLAGCKTPAEKQVAHIETSNGFQPEIQFVLEESFKPNEIRCIAVGDNCGLVECHTIQEPQ